MINHLVSDKFDQNLTTSSHKIRYWSPLHGTKASRV